MVFCYVGTKTFTYSHKKLGFLAQKQPNLVQNLHFLSFWAKYCHFLHMLSNARPKNNVNKVPRWVLRYMGIKTFDFSSKKKEFFCPKTTKFGPKLAFLVNLGQAMQAYSVPCWWVGWWLWRAGCISQDTYLLYIYVGGPLVWLKEPIVELFFVPFFFFFFPHCDEEWSVTMTEIIDVGWASRSQNQVLVRKNRWHPPLVGH